MDPSQRAAQNLIRLVSAGLILVGGMLLGLEFIVHRVKHTEISLLKVGAYGLLLGVGILLLAASKKLAASWAGVEPEVEEDSEPPEE